MARPGIGFEEVRAAAVTLLGRGLNPSIQRVREILGTGSNSTIAAHLKRWQEELYGTPRTVLPPAVPEALTSALEQFWQVAVEQAESGYQERKAAADQAVAAAEQARDLALAELSQTQQQNRDLGEALHRQRELTAGLERRLLVEQEQRSAAEARIAAAERRTEKAIGAADAACAEAAARCQTLAEDLTRTREEAAQRLADERRRGEAGEARLLGIIDQTRREHAAERQGWSQELAAWRARAAALEEDLLGARQALQVGDLERARVETRWQTRWQQSEAELGRLREAQQALEERYLNAARLTEALRGKLKAALGRQRRLEKELLAYRQAFAERPAPVSPAVPAAGD